MNVPKATGVASKLKGALLQHLKITEYGLSLLVHPVSGKAHAVSEVHAVET